MISRRIQFLLEFRSKSQSSLRDFDKGWTRIEKTFDRAVQRSTELEKSVTRFSRQFGLASARSVRAADAMEERGGRAFRRVGKDADAATEKAKGLTDIFNTMASHLGVPPALLKGAAFLTTVRYLTRHASSFEDAAFGVGVQAERLGNYMLTYGRIIRSIGQDTGASLSDISTGMKVLVKNQIKGEDVLTDYSEAALKYSLVTGLGADATAQMVVNLQALVKGRVDVMRMFGSFKYLTENTRLANEQLGSLIERARDVSLGFEFSSEASAAFMRSAAASGAVLSDVFADPNLFINLFDKAQQFNEEAQKVRNVLAAVGVDFQSTEYDIASFSLAFIRSVKQIPIEHLRRFGHAYEQAFGVDRLTLMKIRAIDMAKAMKLFSEAASASSDPFQNAWDDAMKTWSFQWGRTKNELGITLKELALPVLTILKDLLTGVKPLLEEFNKYLAGLSDEGKAEAVRNILLGLVGIATIKSVRGGILGQLLGLVGGSAGGAIAGGAIAGGAARIGVFGWLGIAARKALGPIAIVATGLWAIEKSTSAIAANMDEGWMKSTLNWMSKTASEMGDILLHPIDWYKKVRAGEIATYERQQQRNRTHQLNYDAAQRYAGDDRTAYLLRAIQENKSYEEQWSSWRNMLTKEDLRHILISAKKKGITPQERMEQWYEQQRRGVVDALDAWKAQHLRDRLPLEATPTRPLPEQPIPLESVMGGRAVLDNEQAANLGSAVKEANLMGANRVVEAVNQLRRDLVAAVTSKPTNTSSQRGPTVDMGETYLMTGNV